VEAAEARTQVAREPQLEEQRESEQSPTAELEQPPEVVPAAVAALDKQVAEAQPAPEPAFAPPTAGNSGSRCMPGALLSRISDKST
jgi:hypothetical protein